MSRALLLLILLRFRALLRRAKLNLKTPRGIIFTVLGLFIFVLWLSGGVISTFMHREPRVDGLRIHIIAPLVMLGFCVLSLMKSDASRTLIFSPPEIDMLFPGPFSRRQLLTYKLVSSSLSTLLVAVFFGFWLARFVEHFLAMYLALVFTLNFIQLFAVMLGLLGQTITERAFTATRRTALLGLGVLVAIPLAKLAIQGGLAMRDHPWLDVAEHWSLSIPGKIILAPFNVFTAMLTATNWSELLTSSGIGLAIIAALFFIVLRMDANFFEAAIVTSQRAYERVARMRRGGGGITAMNVRKATSLRLPMLPYLGGAGPIAWRQLLNALRHSRGLVVILIIFAATFAVMFMSIDRGEMHVPDALVAPMIMWLVFMLPMFFRFDFRGDLDHLAMLKSMPLRPLAIAAGQLITPLVILSCIDLAVIGIVGSLILQARPSMLAIAAIGVVPFNLLLLGIENFFILYFPIRLTPGSVMDFQTTGRSMVLALVRMLALGTVVGMSFGVGALATFLAGGDYLTGAIAGSFFAMLCGFALLPLIAWTFMRFDPAIDTPT